MTTIPDQASVSAEQRRLWDPISSGWEEWLETFERGGALVTGRLLALGGVRTGQRVLDVGTGLGEPALTAARAVGPDGHVLGIDVAPEMLRRARRRAAGMPYVRFAEGEPETLPAGERFDVVLSRWCLMFMADPVDSLRVLRGLLVPGGVLAAAVWGPPPAAPMVGLPFRVLSQRLEFPEPPEGARHPGPYALAQPDECVAALEAAGYVDASVTTEKAPFWVGSPAEYARFAHAILPTDVKRMLRDKFGSDEDPDTWREVAELAGQYIDADGHVALTSTVLCLRAVAPRADQG